MKKQLFILFAIICISTNLFAQNDSTQKEFLGNYSFPSGSVVREVFVSSDSTGVLYIESSQGNSILEKTNNPDSFKIVSFQGIAVFKRNADKKIIGVVIDAMGYHLEGTKDKVFAIVDRNRNLLKLLHQQFVVG